MRRSSERCTCGHVRGGHFFGTRSRVWGPCLRCPFNSCRRFELAGPGNPPEPRQDRSTRGVLANVYCDQARGTVALLLDTSTANIVLFAVRALASESEAHAREVRAVAAALPVTSYGAANRERIAARQERVAARCRAVDVNYRIANEGVVA